MLKKYIFVIYCLLLLIIVNSNSSSIAKTRKYKKTTSTTLLAVYKLNNIWYAVDENGKELYSNNKILDVEKYSEGLLGTYFNDNNYVNCGYYNDLGKLVLTSPTHVPYPFQNGLAIVIHILDTTGREAKFGFINKKGKLVVPVKYLNVRAFSDKLAYVMNFDERGFIDTSGRFVIKMEKGFAGYGFSEGLSAVSSTAKELFGFVDTKGKLVLDYQFNEVGKFSEGLCKVHQDGLFGYINKKGFWVINPRFYEATEFKCQRAFVSNFNFDKDAHEWAIINSDGVLLTLYKFDSYKSFSEDLAAVKIGKNWTYINKTGEPAFTDGIYYKFAGSFKNNRAVVVALDNSKYVINKSGEKVFSIPDSATIILDCRTNERYESNN